MIHLKKQLLKMTAVVMAVTLQSQAQTQDWKTEKRVNLLFGVAQTAIAKGYNVEVNYIHNRFIFDYSHGASLDFSGNLLPDDLKRQQLAIHEPYTTGFGIGYRLKEWINIRVEPKWHRFEFYYEGSPQNKSTEITAYNAFSLGLGVYGSYIPFKKKDNFLKGFIIAPSIRFWPTVSSSLKGNKFSYFNTVTGQNEEIKTLDSGSKFTPWVANVSIGYSFQFKKKH
ncbi:hypothetical protein [Flavobacterium wongokense]|uniref:hypothetical protein n=1 Tax=Flavobacterium wongokense TaxID=2910674 RepID=UPI001F1B5DD4|nr:hypothetical protein [Flavobacterium sp. WG47]MCF6133149.1 hypothetical protein [Flavobacterium sp. WG47]